MRVCLSSFSAAECQGHVNTSVGSRTKLGQKAEMFWMETRPTKSDIGKTQKMVKALSKIVVKRVKTQNQKSIPDTETDDPVLDKLDPGIRVRGGV